MAETQPNLNQGTANKMLDEMLKTLTINKQKDFVFLLIGRTGVGKSSTINTLMGQQVAEVGDYEATTMKVEFYKSELNNIKYVVIDTPGLCDDVEEQGNDRKYLELIRSKISHFDCMWLVTRLDETRVSSDEKRGIRLISEALGPKAWEHALIVFTFAASVDSSKYELALQKRTELIRKEIEQYSNNTIAQRVPSVAVDNKSEVTPDGKKWLGTLYTTVFSRISSQGVTSFLMATAPSLKPKTDNHREQPRIELSPENKKEIRKRIDAEVIPGLAAVGAGIGAVFGPAGVAVGGAVGAVVGLIAWLWD